MSDEFEKWWKINWIDDDDVYLALNSFAKSAFTAGQASGRAEIMARFPKENEIDDRYKNAGMLARAGWYDGIYWLRSRLFPNDKQDEVK